MAACIRASAGRGYFSKHLLADAIEVFYTENKLFPNGLRPGLPAIDEWVARNGQALARLVPCLGFLALCGFEAARFRATAKRSPTSKSKDWQWIREEVQDCVESWAIIFSHGCGVPGLGQSCRGEREA